MSLLLTLERAPHPQAVRQMRLETGALVIGRSAEADWRIEDPDSFVSRAHCTIAAAPGGFTVTDTSSGGLYLDDAARPLGPGNGAALADGMRLRLGDYVVRVEMQGAAAPRPPAPASRIPASLNHDDFFATPAPAEPARPRPAGLPEPFEREVPTAFFGTEPAAAKPVAPPAFDDPFTLDPLPAARAAPAADPAGFSWNDPAPEPAAVAPRPAEPASAPNPGLRDAFFRGLGLDAADAPGRDAVAQMEAFGRDYRLMMEGLMHLLRKRAQEKGNARLAQTVVGSAEVNPLKFMPTVDAALATLAAERAPGFLAAEAAIAGAVRDLAQHHVSAWRGVQTALARMIDRFDPAALEEELKALSRFETLLAGGRRAKLWELYEDRYREIARNAEQRFLGEVGADFRDAYESKGD